jgi:hypothetical protein
MTRDTVTYGDFGEERSTTKAEDLSIKNNKDPILKSDKERVIDTTKKELSTLRITPWSNNNVP